MRRSGARSDRGNTLPLILQSRVYRSDLKANPRCLYVFGDNEQRVGLGGQAAEMRGEPNAIGVATLVAPGCFWADIDSQRQCCVIDGDIGPIFTALHDGKCVIFPRDGIGTGLADLERRSPLTFAYLLANVEQLMLYAPK